MISPKEIWDACGIVDTEYYRQLVEALYQSSIMYKAKTESDINNEARKKRIPNKHVSRYLIRMPAANAIASREPVRLPEYSKVFVGNTSPNTTKEQLYDAFQNIGQISDIFTPIDFKTSSELAALPAKVQ